MTDLQKFNKWFMEQGFPGTAIEMCHAAWLAGQAAK